MPIQWFFGNSGLETRIVDDPLTFRFEFLDVIFSWKHFLDMLDVMNILQRCRIATREFSFAMLVLTCFLDLAFHVREVEHLSNSFVDVFKLLIDGSEVLQPQVEHDIFQVLWRIQSLLKFGAVNGERYNFSLIIGLYFARSNSNRNSSLFINRRNSFYPNQILHFRWIQIVHSFTKYYFLP